MNQKTCNSFKSRTQYIYFVILVIFKGYLHIPEKSLLLFLFIFIIGLIYKFNPHSDFFYILYSRSNDNNIFNIYSISLLQSTVKMDILKV